jgi:hypothetical protein
LYEVIARYQREPFRYGVHDCGLFGARVRDAVTYSDFERRLEYRDMRTALRFLRNGGGLEATVSRFLGPPKTGSGAGRADICLLDSTTLGVCTGPEVEVLTDIGLEPRPRSLIVKYWPTP